MSVDLRTCKPGDKLRSKHGLILTYMGPNPYGTANVYPHRVKYPRDKIHPRDKIYGVESYGTRTDDGFVMSLPEARLETDHDIVEIIPS